MTDISVRTSEFGTCRAGPLLSQHFKRHPCRMDAPPVLGMGSVLAHRCAAMCLSRSEGQRLSKVPYARGNFGAWGCCWVMGRPQNTTCTWWCTRSGAIRVPILQDLLSLPKAMLQVFLQNCRIITSNLEHGSLSFVRTAPSETNCSQSVISCDDAEPPALTGLRLTSFTVSVYALMEAA